MMMQEKFSHADAQDIARIIHRTKPAWDEPGIVAALGRIAYDLDIVQALNAGLSAARDPEAKSPAAISWERHVSAKPAAVQNNRTARCRDHPTFDAATCRCCWSEVKTGMRPERLIGHKLEAVPTGAASALEEEA